MQKSYTAKITYEVKRTHPDFNRIPNWYEGKVMSFDDIYTFSDWDKVSAIQYMKNDLALIAGGGYNSDHIFNVHFEIAQTGGYK